MKCLELVLATLLACGMMSGCRDKPAEPAAGDVSVDTNRPISGSQDVQFHLVRGVVKKIEPAEKSITIQHEEIPRYMAAMTMPFKVKDAKELEGLQVGDTIWFRLWVAPDESWIDKVKKEQAPQGGSQPQASAAPEREAFRIARDVEPLNVGDPLPDYQFTNELGRTVSFGQFRRQALAFTFIFTRCPLPDFCPRMSRNFQEVYQKLTARADAPTNWHLFSISFDPHFDTPAVLRSYAQAFQYDPKRWSFITGAMIDIDAITDQFNLAIMKRGTEWDHKVRTVVVDAAGRVQKIIYGNEWKPEVLVEELITAARVTPPEPSAEPAKPQ